MKFLNQNLVSVVITTKNEQKNIENCLASIKRQSYPAQSIEIIVVDNQSNDQTKEIARKYTNKVFDKGPERSAQRNYGIMEVAQGEYVLYLDADMQLSKKVIEKGVEKFQEDDRIVALYISEIVTGNCYLSRVRRFERSFYDGTVIDGVRFVKRDKFKEVGGFDLSLTGPEDWDLDKKLKEIGKFALLQEPIYHNEEEFDLYKYLFKKSYYGRSFERYIHKWGKNDKDIQKQFGFIYRYFVIFFEDKKWKKLIKNPALAFGMYFLRFLVGIIFLFRKP